MPSAGCRLSLVICRIKWFSSFCRRRIKGAAYGSRVLPLITFVGMQKNLSLRHIFIASSEFVDGSRVSHALTGWSLNLNLIQSLISKKQFMNKSPNLFTIVIIQVYCFLNDAFKHRLLRRLLSISVDYFL